MNELEERLINITTRYYSLIKDLDDSLDALEEYISIIFPIFSYIDWFMPSYSLAEDNPFKFDADLVEKELGLFIYFDMKDYDVVKEYFDNYKITAKVYKNPDHHEGFVYILFTEICKIIEEKKITKVMIVQPIIERTTKQIIEEYRLITHKLEKQSKNQLSIIDTIIEDSELKSGLQYISDSIDSMKQADLIVFAEGWESEKECRLIHDIAIAYEKPIMFAELLVDDIECIVEPMFND